GPGIAALERAAGGLALRGAVRLRPAWRRDPGGRAAIARLPARRRGELGRLRRRLERDHPDAAVVRVEDAPGWLDDFLRLEGRGWKGRAGIAAACRPGEVRFLR